MKNSKGKGAGAEASANPQKPGAQQIEQIPVADLIPYARNARTHSEEQVGQIAGSIQEFGFNVPILIDGQNSIIAGHGRVMAAQRLKLDTVPCIRLTHLTDAQRRAYILADNRIALNSGWDEAMLQVELEELHADDVDLGLLGFEADELAKTIGLEEDELQLPDMSETTSHTVVVRYNPEDKDTILRWLGGENWSEQGLGKRIIERIRNAAARN